MTRFEYRFRLNSMSWQVVVLHRGEVESAVVFQVDSRWVSRSIWLLKQLMSLVAHLRTCSRKWTWTSLNYTGLVSFLQKA